MKTLLFCLFVCALAFAQTAVAGTMIASQDFESNSLTVGFDGNTANDAAVNAGFSTTTGVAFDGLGLGWTASISSSSAPITDNDSGDLIGVVDSSITSGPNLSPNNLRNATGIQGKWFHVSDADGTVSVAFDSIDTTGFADLMLEFIWAAHDTDYETGDGFDVSVNGTSVFSEEGDSGTSTETLASGPQTDNFTAVSLDLSAFDGQAIDLVFSISNNSGTEDIGFDSVVLSGTATVPEPAAFACFAIGCMGMTLVRRRRR